VRIELDAERDVAYIRLEDVRRPHPWGGSNMILPPAFPFRVDLFCDAEERLVAVRVEEASKNLHPDALELAIPFEPFNLSVEEALQTEEDG
jgi:hypothetical protein